MKYTLNHKLEEPYIALLLKEWQLYLSKLGGKPKLTELHLGGGTPTFFSPENLEHLLQTIFDSCEIPKDHAFSLEASPQNTKRAHLEVLYRLGFRRLSLGIQDFDPHVQQLINRIQPPEEVWSVLKQAREIGFESINFDLIYGLPGQTQHSIEQTFEHIRAMRPERIAYYSYAHVPWVKGIQRNFSEEDLPKNELKRTLYELGKQLLEEDGYLEVGMDHFALPGDELIRAAESGILHRNFMGYTTHHTRLMIGLGMSSISDSWDGFAQNYKNIREYRNAVEAGKLPIFRGHLLTEEDAVLRQHILNLMCQFHTEWNASDPYAGSLSKAVQKLVEMEADGLIQLHENSITVLDSGKPFVRNVCMALDARLHRKYPDKPIFSSTI